ncbi:MAG: substrate-binding domain-containing protein, partial [Phaeodactylibacter sp.]|nr:substrate-binding domain-containing protein [Phaeodactylibacter sp.]
KAIRSFIAQGVDVISFSPVVETGFEQVLEEAKKAGIPVVLSDRAVDVSDPTLYKCFIGSDFVEEGRRAAQWFIDIFLTVINIIIIKIMITFIMIIFITIFAESHLG